MGVHSKIHCFVVFFLGGGGGGGGGGAGVNRLKMRLGQLADFRGDLAKEGIMFLRQSGVETPMHTMSWTSFLIDTNIQSKQHCNTVLLLMILTIIDTQFLKKSQKKINCGITNPKNPNQQIDKTFKLWSEKVMQGQQYL